jgi:hypothetical protein
MVMTPFHLIGIDPGQAHDPTAVALIEWDPIQDPVYRLRGLYRFPLGTPYTDLPRALTSRLGNEHLSGHVALAIDATGVGAPVVDHFRQELTSVPIYAITITAGTSVSGTAKNPHVPKRDLISTTSVIFEQRRIAVAASMRDTETLRDELLAYRRSTTERGSYTYGAASGSHDDLVLALSIALWTAEHRHLTPPRRYRSQMDYLRTIRIPGVDAMLASQPNQYPNYRRSR